GTGRQIGANPPPTSPITPIATIVTAKKRWLALFTSIAALPCREDIKHLLGVRNDLSSNGRFIAVESQLAVNRFPADRRTASAPPMTDTDESLTGKLALVTGASRGIGAATAEALAKAGAHVILVARTATALEEVEERIHDAAGSATIAPLDLTEGEAIGKLAVAVGERWAKLDALILNAAML